MNRLLFALLLTLPFSRLAAQTAWTALNQDFDRSVCRISGNLVAFFTLDQPGYAYFGTPAAFLISTPADRFFKRESLNWTSETAEVFRKTGNAFGDGLTPLALTTGLYSAGLLLDNPRLRETGRTLGEAMIYSVLSVQTIKMVAGRSRPYLEKGPYDWGHASWTNDSRFSFPSGHTMAAFTVATVLAEDCPLAGKIFWYSLAGTTAWARIASDRHWFSDTVTGAWIGFTSARAALNPEYGKEDKLTLLPVSGGLRLVVRF